MPFKSEAQRRFLWARHPSVAREFADATPKGTKLPYHVAGAKKKRAKKADDATDQTVNPWVSRLNTAGNFLGYGGLATTGMSVLPNIADKVKNKFESDPFAGDNPAVKFIKKPPLMERFLGGNAVNPIINSTPQDLQEMIGRHPDVFGGQTADSLIARAAQRYGSNPRASRLGASLEAVLDVNGKPNAEKLLNDPEDMTRLFKAREAMRGLGLGAVSSDVQRRLLAKDPIAENYLKQRGAVARAAGNIGKVRPIQYLTGAATQFGLGFGLHQLAKRLATPRGADIEIPPQASTPTPAEPTPTPAKPTAVADTKPTPIPSAPVAEAPSTPAPTASPKSGPDYTVPIAVGAGALGLGGLAAYLKHRRDQAKKRQQQDEQGDEPEMEMRKAAFIMSMDPQQQAMLAQAQQQQAAADPNAAAMPQAPDPSQAAAMPDQPATVGQPQVAGAVAGPATVDPRNPGEAAGLGGMAPLQSYQGGLNAQIGGLKLAADIVGSNMFGMRLIKRAEGPNLTSPNNPFGGVAAYNHGFLHNSLPGPSMANPHASGLGVQPGIGPVDTNPQGPSIKAMQPKLPNPATSIPGFFNPQSASPAPALRPPAPNIPEFTATPVHQPPTRPSAVAPPAWTDPGAALFTRNMPSITSPGVSPNPGNPWDNKDKIQPWNNQSFTQMIANAPTPKRPAAEEGQVIDTSGSHVSKSVLPEFPASKYPAPQFNYANLNRNPNAVAPKDLFNNARFNLANKVTANTKNLSELANTPLASQFTDGDAATARRIFNNPGGSPRGPVPSPFARATDQDRFYAATSGSKQPKSFTPTDGSAIDRSPFATGPSADPFAAYKNYMPGGNQGAPAPKVAPKPAPSPSPRPAYGPARGDAGGDFWAGTKNVIRSDPGYLGASDAYYGSPSAYPSSHPGDPIYHRFRPGNSTGSSVYGSSRHTPMAPNPEAEAKGREFLEGLKQRQAARQASGIVAPKPRLNPRYT